MNTTMDTPAAQTAVPQTTSSVNTGLVQRYLAVRAASEALCAPLATEDYCIQTMTEVSPPKWHLAHTSWFFECFILSPLVPGYSVFHPRYHELFNSYYETVGRPYPRPRRGLLSRPTVEEVYRYRAHVDAAMTELLESLDAAAHTQWSDDIAARTVLGLHHEQQHQELLLTDIKHIFAANPLRPVYRELPEGVVADAMPMTWCEYEGGVHAIGHEGAEFAFDNETPRHRSYLNDFALASRLVTNAEFMAFIDADGYRRPELWLSDGWAAVQREDWQAPLYWERCENQWWQMTLAGMRLVQEAEPVCHVSVYEADAYARWVGQRLPTEAEWELAAAPEPVAGNLRESGYLQPCVAAGTGSSTPTQLFGDVWEWTASAYTPYPGYHAPPGAFGEYNGKFMSGQMVLRGGSCVTPADHIRPTYRNFFYPGERWQFMGMRLAADR